MGGRTSCPVTRIQFALKGCGGVSAAELKGVRSNVRGVCRFAREGCFRRSLVNCIRLTYREATRQRIACQILDPRARRLHVQAKGALTGVSDRYVVAFATAANRTDRPRSSS